MAGKIAKPATVDGERSFAGVSPKSVSLIVETLMMHEILPRLQVKPLARFKLVSKRWNSTISSIEFAKLHLKFSCLNDENRHFIIKSYGLIPYCERVQVKEKRYHFRFYYLYTMVDSCDGIVFSYERNFLGGEWHCFFTLSNPANLEDWHVPSPLGVHVSKAHGFGFVSSLNDILVVASFGTGDTVDGSTFRGFYVFSLKALKWERILGRFDYVLTPRQCWKWKRVRGESDEERIAKGLKGTAVMVGDTMYWASDNIVGFDLLKRKLKQYPRLDWQCWYSELELFRVKGCLALLGSRVIGESDFWVLTNPGDWSSWQKTLSIDLSNISLLTFSETGKCLVRQPKEFKLVDASKEALESAKDGGFYRRQGIAKDHVESLISPFALIKAGEKEDETENSEPLENGRGNRDGDEEDEEDDDDEVEDDDSDDGLSEEFEDLEESDENNNDDNDDDDDDDDDI